MFSSFQSLNNLILQSYDEGSWQETDYSETSGVFLFFPFYNEGLQDYKHGEGKVKVL